MAAAKAKAEKKRPSIPRRKGLVGGGGGGGDAAAKKTENDPFDVVEIEMVKIAPGKGLATKGGGGGGGAKEVTDDALLSTVE